MAISLTHLHTQPHMHTTYPCVMIIPKTERKAKGREGVRKE